MRRTFNLSFFVAIIALAQQSPPEPSFRAGTDLVQINVVAQDKTGKPVTDLGREDFQIFDDGAQQTIRLFLSESPTAALPETRAPGIFTNQIADGRGGYSVLLFDNLNVNPGNAEFAHTARARQKALLALREIPPDDKIAIYALGCRFQVVREFTSDRDSLIRQLETFSPAPGPCMDPSSGDPPPRPTMAQLMVSGPTRADGTPMTGTAPPISGGGHAAEGMAAVSSAVAADLADRETLQLAEHLAGIPGRKNLIWLTTTFYVRPSNLRKLINAEVAIYPVDTQGSTIALAMDKAARAAMLGAIAAQTGGVAFVDRDDLDMGIRGALNDGRISYTLGFYRPGQDNKSVHQIGVRVTRPGVALRYRTSYTVEPPPPKSANPVTDLVRAMNSPVDATAIRLMASVTRSQNRLDISGAFDVAALDLEPINGLWKGKAEFVARFVTADGRQAGNVVAVTMMFNLRPATYTSALQRGLRFNRQIAIPPKAVDMDLLIGNVATGKIGTLKIPLAEVGVHQ